MPQRNIVGAVAVSWLLQGCATTGPSVLDQIRELEQQQVQVALKGDRAGLERIFAPDFRMVSPTGAMATREELLALLAGGTAPYRSATYTTNAIKLHGNVVVSTGTESVMPTQAAANAEPQRRRITQVWEQQDGRWRLILRHATLVAAPP